MGLHVARQCGAAGEPRARGGVSPDICKFIAQGTVQLFATASHRLDVAANIESIYRFFKKFRTFFTAQFLVFGCSSRSRFYLKIVQGE